MGVLSERELSSLSRFSATLIASVTGILVKSETTSKDTKSCNPRSNEILEKFRKLFQFSEENSISLSRIASETSLISLLKCLKRPLFLFLKALDCLS